MLGAIVRRGMATAATATAELDPVKKLFLTKLKEIAAATDKNAVSYFFII